MKYHHITYPYIPANRDILYVESNNEFMKEAQKVALEQSLDQHQQAGVVIVSKDIILGTGANGSTYHKEYGCERVRRNIPTGQGYELCEGCHPKNHAEQKAIADALQQGGDITQADLYLWGHWWCCQSCWEVMMQSGIKRVFLEEGSEKNYNRDHPENILTKKAI